MRHVKTIKKLTVSSIEALEFDLFICSSGYESRATYLTEKYNISSTTKVAFSFDDRIDQFNRSRNDHLFKEKGIQLITSNGDSGKDILNFLEKFDFSIKSKFNILIDYSSMTRVWYASILKFFKLLDVKEKEITLYFSYSPAMFNIPPDAIIPNINVGPITGYSNLSISNKPTSLIIGLGYEIDRAYGLTEYLDAETYLFYTSTNNNNLFSSLVEKNNEELIKSVSPENIFTYNLDDIEYTFFVLSNLCERLSKTKRIVLAPCGPKPFTVLCLLVSNILPNIDVWRISAGKKSIPIDRIPNGEIILFKMQLDVNK